MREGADFGYVESGQRLLGVRDRSWNPHALRDAARRAELRNTGWAIGLVFDGGAEAPTPTEAGIEARVVRVGPTQWEDYWRFERDGSYYVIRLFEEDFDEPTYGTSVGHPEKPLWLDLRIFRIAEMILHSASLYRALEVPPNEPYVLSVNHGGLRGREFWANSSRWHLRRGRVAQVDESHWEGEVTQDYINTSLKEITHDVANELFGFFDFANVSRSAINQLVDKFLAWRVGEV